MSAHLATRFRELFSAEGPAAVPSRFEVEMLHKNGSTVWVDVSMRPIYDQRGMPIGYSGASRDITRRKAAEDALLRLNRELEARISHEVDQNRQKDMLLMQHARLVQMGEMIGNIAHQWRQPINSIAIILADLIDAYDHDACTSAYLHDAVNRATAIMMKMSATIDEFRYFHRDTEGTDGFDLGVAVADCLALHSTMLAHHRIAVQNEVPPQLLVAGSASGFGQCLTNLLTNAKEAITQHGNDNGLIRITVAVTHDTVQLFVADNGGGMTEAVLAGIFKPYFTTKPDGTGIGLYMTRAIVERKLHGRITASNIDDGACLCIELKKQAVEGVDHDNAPITESSV